MKEIFKSKLMLGLILFIMGVCYLNNSVVNVDMKESSENNTVVLNQN